MLRAGVLGAEPGGEGIHPSRRGEEGTLLRWKTFLSPLSIILLTVIQFGRETRNDAESLRSPVV